MSEPIRRLLVAYDISDDRRRDRLAVLLQSYGERVQYSVFLVDGRPASFVRLRHAVATLIDRDVDSVMFVDLGPRDRAKSERISFLGRRVELTGDRDALIV
jgi:CRISPR-associated protein Cas2